MKFSVDKKKVSEGESFTVSWECNNPDMVSLAVEDGVKYHIQLGDSGARVIMPSGNADKITLILKASVSGKIEEKKATVKVKRKVLKAERVDCAPKWGQSGGKKAFDFSKIKDWFTSKAEMFKTAWGYMPTDKKLAYKILGFIMLAMILTSISPKLMAVGMGALVGYLIWIILKR